MRASKESMIANANALVESAAKGDLAPIKIKPFEYREHIPPRKIITIGGMKCFAKGFLSVTGAAGGVGKSSLAIVEELSLVYGLDLLEHLSVDHLTFAPLKCGRQRVWTMSLEDDEEEHQRRVTAAIRHYKLDPSMLDGWYFVTYKADSPVTIASTGRDGFIVSPHVKQIEEMIASNQIDFLMVDPFVNSHGVNESENGAMNMVADIWRSICQEMEVATNLTHHIRKLGGLTEISSDDLRGASSLVGAARLVRVLAPMSKDEAARFGIDEERRRFYVWVNPSAKANIAPPASARHWFHLASVDLENGQDCWDSDSIGVIEYWEPPRATVVNQQDAHFALFAATIGKDDSFFLDCCRTSSQSPSWIGRLIAEILRLDLPKNKDAIKAIIRKMQSSKLIFEDEINSKDYKSKGIYRINKPNNWEDSDDVL